MTQPNNQQWSPTIDESKVPPEIAQHLRLLFDRARNHANAIANLAAQVKALQKAAKGAK